MRVFNYCRKSVFSETSDSIRNQNRMCGEYVQSRFTIDSWTDFSDEDYSGANTDRPGLKAMLKLIEADQCDLLIVYALDRLSRNVRDFSNIYALLEEHHVNFICLDRNIDTSTPIGEAIMYISAAFAQMERKTIATRIEDNMIGLAKSGFWVGGNPPIGYVRQNITVAGRKHVTIVPDPEQADYVRQLFDLFLIGNFSLTGFETYHRQHGLLSPRGKAFSASQLWQILTSPFYCPASPEVYDYYEKKGCQMEVPRDAFDGSRGVSVYGRTSEKSGKHEKMPPESWKVTIGLHEPLISADTWLAVQARMKKHVYVKKKKHPPALLHGALRCKCGWKMVVAHKKKIDGSFSSWYHCLKRERSGMSFCDMSAIRTEYLDDKVLEVFRNIALDPDLKKEYQAPEKPDPLPIEKNIKSLEKKIQKLTSSLAVAKNSAATKYILAEIERLDAELTDLQLKRADAMIVPEAPNLAGIQSLVTDIERFSAEEKNQIILDTVKNLVWDGESLSITL